MNVESHEEEFLPIYTGLFSLTEVAFSRKPLDLLMRSTESQEPLMLHGCEVSTDFIMVAWTEERECVIK